mmetsp:Transcript_9821/g.14369  ORF Transcript_9821/g.14369 Transcript_9821/m.14369 type:complete len:326 (-) Transcript_9821:100-1077(-)
MEQNNEATGKKKTAIETPVESVLNSTIVSKSKWKVFVEDPQRRSYSYYLPFPPSHPIPFGINEDTKSQQNEQVHNLWFVEEQLDSWFDKLHPNSLGVNNTGAWTDAHYQGELLLRKTAWCVYDQKCTCEYGYSDTWQPQVTCPNMKNVLREITSVVENILGLEFNCVNLNYYSRGSGVGFHADDEFLFDGLERDTLIVSLSLCSKPPPLITTTEQDKEQENASNLSCLNDHSSYGARKFQVRFKEKGQDDSKIADVILKHGDLMTMEGMFQKHYEHSVWPGDSKNYTDHPLTQGERINLTWRTIVRHLDGSPECMGITCPLSSAP